MAEENQQDVTPVSEDVKPTSGEGRVAESTVAGETLAHEVAPNVDSQPGDATGSEAGKRGNRAQKVGIVASDKMEKTVVVRVDRLIKHPKYRRYVRRTSRFMAHDETGASIGDKVRIVETRPLSTRKRWRVVEIVQKAEK
jgi:small subunit ribosomal protein S17